MFALGSRGELKSSSGVHQQTDQWMYRHLSIETFTEPDEFIADRCLDHR